MSENSDPSLLWKRRFMLPALALILVAAGARAGTPTAEVKPFGHGIFPKAPLDFTIAADAPVPESYQLDNDDRVRIRYWTPSIPETAHELVVNGNGMVEIPGIGDVRAAGLTRAEFRKRVGERLAEQLINPSFSAELIETRRIVVFVTGAARYPGRYVVKAESNLFNVIYGAGGPADDGSMRRVTLFRKDQSRAAVSDLYKFLIEGVSDRDVILKDQDTIFFPPTGPRVTVKGQVLRPAVYEVLENSTIADALTLASGLSASAYPRILRLERVEDARRVERTLDAVALLNDPSHADNMVLRGGDVLTVEELSGQVHQRVAIRGNVEYPGDYSTLRTPTARTLITEARPLTGTFRERADLMRVSNDGAPIVVPIPLDGLLSGSAEDIPLLDRDEIVIYRSDEKTIIPLVTVEGAVRNPATFRKTDGMRASDLIFAAGGMLTDASPEVAHIYRRTGPNESRIIRISPSQTVEEIDAQNPVLHADDRLVVYRQTDVDYKSDKVTILGEVQRPGEYQAHEGLSLYDLIIQAGGPTDMAAGTVEIACPVSESGKKASVKICTLTEAMAGARRDDAIESGTLVSLPRRGDRITAPLKVELKGQFTRPGTYALLYEGEPLESLIERAGGLCENADPFGMSLTRQKDQMLSTAAGEQVKTVLNSMDQLLPPVSEEPNSMLLSGAGEAGVSGRTGAGYGIPGMGGYDAVLLVSPRRLREMPTSNRITFSLEDKESYLKRIGGVRLSDGDVIEAPRLSEVVQVLGAVQSPGPVFYVGGYSANDYIHRAGGGAPDADFKRSVVISVAGIVQPLGRVKEVNPGDVIVVASKHQIIQPPRHRTLFETLGNLLGGALIIRGLK